MNSVNQQNADGAAAQATEPAAAGAAPEAATDLKPLQAALETARAQAAENLDKFLRAKAETENVRRRAEIDVPLGRNGLVVPRFTSSKMLRSSSTLRTERAE